MDGSPPTICRPGVVSAVDPAKGSVLKVKVVASAVLPTSMAASVMVRIERRM